MIIIINSGWVPNLEQLFIGATSFSLFCYFTVCYLWFQYLQDGVTGGKVLDASNRFFTLIPHDFGLKTPPLLDQEEVINNKVKMLDSLLEIEIAYNLLKGGSQNDNQDPLDVHYSSLKADIKVCMFISKHKMVKWNLK